MVSNLETGEPLWFERERKKQTLDESFDKHLSAFQRSAIRAACVDMWEPFRQSLEQWVPKCRIIYDKFHILRHACQAVDEVRRAKCGGLSSSAKEDRICTAWTSVLQNPARTVVWSAARRSRPQGLGERGIPPDCRDAASELSEAKSGAQRFGYRLRLGSSSGFT